MRRSAPTAASHRRCDLQEALPEEDPGELHPAGHLELITTEKDAARLKGDASVTMLAALPPALRDVDAWPSYPVERSEGLAALLR